MMSYNENRRNFSRSYTGFRYARRLFAREYGGNEEQGYNENVSVQDNEVYYYEVIYPDWVDDGVIKSEYQAAVCYEYGDVCILVGDDTYRVISEEDDAFTDNGSSFYLVKDGSVVEVSPVILSSESAMSFIKEGSVTGIYLPEADALNIKIDTEFENVLNTTAELFYIDGDGELPSSRVDIFTEKLSSVGENETSVAGVSCGDLLLKRESDGAATVNKEVEETFGVWNICMYTVTGNNLLSFFSYDRSNYSGYGMYSYLYDLENDVLVDKETFLAAFGVDLDSLIAQANADAQRLVGTYDGAVVKAETSIEGGQWDLFVVDEKTVRIYYAEILYGDGTGVFDPDPLVVDDVYITVTVEK